MEKIFNVSGACRPDRHYMVDLKDRLDAIRKMVDRGQYFTINRARQYGKTTVLRALADDLEHDYVVVSLDFQMIETDEFASGSAFVHALAREISRKLRRRKAVPEEIREILSRLSESTSENTRMAELFGCFSRWCEQSEKPIVLMIDEIDTATNNQVFLDFLAQLRASYLDRDETPAFQSVILAGLYDVRNIRRKIRQEEEHRSNSPWNIAADFLVSMSFSVKDIAGMLESYEADKKTGMDIDGMSQLKKGYMLSFNFNKNKKVGMKDIMLGDKLLVEAVV